MNGLLYYFTPFENSWEEFVKENNLGVPSNNDWKMHALYWMEDVLFGIHKQVGLDIKGKETHPKSISLLMKISDVIEEMYGNDLPAKS